MSDQNIYQRLAAAMQEVTYVRKEKKQGMQYSVVSHDDVTAKVRPVLLKHGVIYHPTQMARSQDGNRTQVDVVVRFVNIDKPEEYIDVPACGYGIDSQDKGPGKAISYAVKYALLKALGLETGDDPDLDQNVKHEPSSSDVDVTNAIKDCGTLDELTALYNGLSPTSKAKHKDKFSARRKTLEAA